MADQDQSLIQSALRKHVSHVWRKNAYVVGFAMGEVSKEQKALGDFFFLAVLNEMIASGEIEGRGFNENMGYGEVRVRQVSN